MRSNKIHKLLFISYFFPPSGGISCQRAIRFAKYLPRFEWNTTVLTYGGKYPWRIIDRTLLSKIESMDVIRVEVPEIDRYFSSKRKKLSNLKTLSAGMLNIDVMSLWGEYVKKQIGDIMEKKQPDLILLTAPPFSSLELIKICKKIDSDIPIIVDMRDLYWILNPEGSFIKKLINRHQLSTAINRIPEWLSFADGLIAPTKAIVENILDEYSSPSIVVPTPYDPDDFKIITAKYNKGEKFKILHSGRIYRSNKPELLLEIFSLLPSDILERTQLILQGYDNDTARNIFSPYRWVKLTDFVSHRDALLSQSTADVNLVYVSENPYRGGDLIIPGKIFDYIGAGRPIFAIGPKDGALVSFVEENKLGFSAPSESPELCADILAKMFGLWEDNKLQEIPEEISVKYSADNVVEKLADFLDSFVDKKKIDNGGR